jgi:hypothetical protein
MGSRWSRCYLWSVIVLACSLAVLSPSHLLAQTAAVTGTVMDSSEASVPGASVKAHNTATGVDSVAQSNDSGVYRIETVPGIYDFTVQKPGFRVLEFNAITLTVGQILTLNARLELGPVTQTVEVSGQTVAPIELESGQISNIVNQSSIVNLPLILRDPYSLVLLSPGVIQSNTSLGGFSANGARERNNNFLLDGIDNNDSDVPGIPHGLTPLNPDSTQEFRVITNNFAPEFGRNNGAIIDVITKSGTNQIHGDAYWFGRYDVTGARDFFNHQPDTPKNPYIRNIFGASAGGPIRKDKTFWFANYEGSRFITSLTNVSAVPNAAFRTGIFPVTNPADGSTSTVDVSTPNSANNGVGLPLDPTIQKILALYPLPNGPAIDDATGQYFFPSSDRATEDTVTIKIDHHIGERNTLSGRYSFDRSNDPNAGSVNFLPPNLGSTATFQRSQNMAVDWTSTLRPTLVNDLRVGGNRTRDPFYCEGAALFNSFGLVDPYGRGADYQLTDPFGAGPADFGCGGANALGFTDYEARFTGTYQIVDGLSWVKNTHTLKFGWEGRDVYSNSFDNFNSRTEIQFAPEYQFAVGPLQGLPDAIVNEPTLNDEVAMLLGWVSSQTQSQFFDNQGVRNASDLRGFRQREMAFYAQDAWKVRPNLTFNYGVRWEYNGIPFEVHNNFSNLFADASGDAPFTFTVVGPGAARPAWNNEYGNFEPRVGFAWDPFKSGKTSIRAAFGMFHDRVFGNLFEDARANPPFQQSYANQDLFPPSAVPLSSLTAPPTVPTSATVTNIDPITGLGGQIYPDLFDPNFHTPYSENWNFGIERQLTQSLTLEVNYVGVRGLRLFRIVDGNPPQPAKIAALEAYCQAPNPYNCVDTPTASTLTGANLWLGYEFGVLPFDAANNTAFEEPFSTPGANLNKSIAQSYYNALQLNLTHRLSHGVQVQGAYTWSHSLDGASDPFVAAVGNRNLPRNSFDLRNEYGNSDFDVRQRLSINFVYQPSLGRGRAYLSHGAVGRMMEGWQLAGITTFQTGLPYEIFGNVQNQHTGLSDRAEIIGNPAIPAGHPRLQTGPPLSAFRNAYYDFASNLSRNRFYGPGVNNWNVSAIKDQSLSDRFKLQLRFEFYNLFNRVQFGQPDNLIGDTGTFGTSSSQVGQPDGTTGARQIQFAMKLLF